MALAAATLLLLWPALYNGFPLLFPDTISYVEDGPRAARAIFLHQTSGYYGIRSMLYPMVIALFHWGETPWPVAILQAAITACSLWLTSLALLGERARRWFLPLCAALALATTVGWTACLIMPDALGAPGYLCLFALAFAPERLGRAGRWAAMSILAWAVSAHMSHLMLALGLMLFLAAAQALRLRAGRQGLRALWRPAAAIAAAMAAMIGVNFSLHGSPSLSGEHPPFIMTRLIVDGPGRWWLQEHCAAEPLAICAHLEALPDNDDDILWSEGGVWQSSTDEEQGRMRREEGRLAVGVLREFPGAQLRISLNNFGRQLSSFALTNGPDGYTAGELDRVLRSSRAAYMASRQGRGVLPNEELSAAQARVIYASLGALAALTPFLWRRRARLWGWLAAVTAFVVLGNAMITGVLSEVDDRYQARVVWLLPWLALLGLSLLLGDSGAAGGIQCQNDEG